MATTKIRTAQAGTPTGGTTSQVLTKNSNTNYDYGWVTPSSSVDVIDVNSFDDFMNVFEVNDGSNDMGSTGNFIVYNSGSNSWPSTIGFATELNHPGIVSLGQTVDQIYGFAETSNVGLGPTASLFPTNSPFSIKFLTRLNYTLSIGWSVRWVVQGSNAGFRISAGGIVQYENGGLVATVIPLPASGTWFEIEINSTDGVNVDLIFNGITAFTGALNSPNPNNHIMASVSTDTNLTSLDIDYIVTNYQVTR